MERVRGRVGGEKGNVINATNHSKVSFNRVMKDFILKESRKRQTLGTLDASGGLQLSLNDGAVCSDRTSISNGVNLLDCLSQSDENQMIEMQQQQPQQNEMKMK